jgi:hypothetical protein
VQEIQASLVSDMVQAIMFRLQAVAKHELAVPTVAPASASTSATSAIAAPATASSAR